jgi:adenylate cyclase
MKFAQLVGSTYANLRELSHLQQRQASLRSFFSPIVLEAISNQDIDHVLEPRECRVSVLFCDLRGFSATSEKMSEHLLRLLDQVSHALGAITSQILDKRGVVGDFHGDAVMGFWGWPLEQHDAATRACQVALSIVDQSESLNQATGQPLDHFLMGLGLATGVAVAGKIGTSDQVKVTVFGPVVNLAARFESLTRAFLVPILIDEATASALRPAVGDLSIRIRRLAKVLPSGLQRAVSIFQVLPDRLPYLHVTDDHLQKYDEALNLFEGGDWAGALLLLRELPDVDRAKDVLINFISSRDSIVPPNWNQVIEFRSK